MSDQLDNPFQPRRPGGWLTRSVSIKDSWAAVTAERKYKITGRFERPSSSGSSTSEASTTSTQLPTRRTKREYPFVKRWLESNTLEEYKAACAAAAAAKSAELAEERNRSIEGQVRIGRIYVAEQFGGDHVAAERYIREQSTEDQFAGFSGAQLAVEQLSDEEHTGKQSFDEQFIEEQHSGTQSFNEYPVGDQWSEDCLPKEHFVHDQHFRDHSIEEQHIAVQSIEDQHTQEHRAESELSGWNLDSEFDTELTVSSRLNIPYIPDESPRDTLRKLSRLLSQSPASRSTMGAQTPKSPEKHTVFESSAPETAPTPFTAKLESLKSPKLETVAQLPAPKITLAPSTARTESLKSPGLETVVQLPVPETTLAPSIARTKSLTSPITKLVAQHPAPETNSTPFTAETELPESPQMGSVAQHPAPETTSTPFTAKIEPLHAPKLETMIQYPAQNSGATSFHPDSITTLSRLEDASMEDTTLDAFQSFQEQMPSTKPTTFEQYFALQVEERERLIDEAVRVRMNNRFNQTKHGLREAKRGIGRLDDFISSMPSAPATAAVSTNSVAVNVSTSKETLFSFEVTADNNIIEQHCSMKYPSWSKLWTTQNEPPTTGRFAGMSKKRKFTWLGLILAIFAAWFLIETVMCEIYCHPVNSSKNTWQPSDPFFPLALPTKVDQWTGGIVSSAFKVMKSAWDTYSDPEGKRFRARGWQRPG